MAILHLILSGNSAARGIPELASVIQKHNSWIEGKKFLLVPYHMIAAHDVESGILGGYVDFVRRVHPDAPILASIWPKVCSRMRPHYGSAWETMPSSLR